jgi:Coenzyme PQQ synthesis protein D (PqqD)
MSDANPRKVEGLEVNEADDGLVVCDPQQDMVHHLNPSAALIFDLCDGSRDADMIALVLSEAYGVTEPLRDQTLAALDDLAGRKLVRWDGHGSAAD